MPKGCFIVMLECVCTHVKYVMCMYSDNLKHFWDELYNGVLQ